MDLFAYVIVAAALGLLGPILAFLTGLVQSLGGLFA